MPPFARICESRDGFAGIIPMIPIGVSTVVPPQAFPPWAARRPRPTVPTFPLSSPQRWDIDAVRRVLATATMAHGCRCRSKDGPSLRLPGPPEQHRWPIVAVAARDWRPGARRARSRGDLNGGHQEPGAERAGNRVARIRAAAPDAVTFTSCTPEPVIAETWCGDRRRPPRSRALPVTAEPPGSPPGPSVPEATGPPRAALTPTHQRRQAGTDGRCWKSMAY